MVNAETTNQALGIDDARKKKLEWYVEEACSSLVINKAESIRKIVENKDATDEEKVYMGYLLTKYIIYKKTPKHLYDLICKLCEI